MAALKTVGCEAVIGFSAVGSMDLNIHPEEVVLVDGYFLYNVNRPNTFYDSEPGSIIHVDPDPSYCLDLREKIADASEAAGLTTHRKGMFLNVQGPHFLPKDQSEILSRLIPQLKVIGMTTYPEVVLAAEAEMCYATVALVTDYNKLPGMPHVTAEQVGEVAKGNAGRAQKILRQLATNYDSMDCKCRHSLDHAVQSYHPDRVQNTFVRELLHRFE